MLPDAKTLFYQVEQSQGPFATNASRDLTRVVQTRTTDRGANNSDAQMMLGASIVFGEHSHSRAVDTFCRVSILGKGSANLNIWSTSNSSWLLIRSGVQRNATLSFERSNRLVHRADLILHSSPNESIATARAIHAATVHILRWTVDSMASLALLGFSSRRPQLSGSLLMPATTTGPRRLMSINDEGKVGTTVLGGSAHVGWAADSSIFASLLGSPQRRSRFASIAAHHLD
eukprot:COSAG01_NODE_12453_length_1736_cov_1.185706_1_plen_230_part_10